MASSPTYHSGTRYHGVRPCHGVHQQSRQQTASAFHPDTPYYYTDVVPLYIVSSPAPIMTPRDMPPIAGRARTSRPSPANQGWMHDVSMLHTHATSHRRTPSPVYFVPDPPTWASPLDVGSPAKVSAEKLVSPRPQTPCSDERCCPVEPHWAELPSTLSPQYGSSSDAAMHHIPLTPPSTPPPAPKLPRLRTPDIKTIDKCSQFCNCCPHIERVFDSRWKMELQCKSMCRPISGS